MRPGHVLAAAVALSLATTACTADDEWGPLAVYEDDTQGGLLVGGGTGRLVITDECVFLRLDGSEEGDTPGKETTLEWRSGQVQWDADDEAIIFEQAESPKLLLQHGDRISIGGGTGSRGEPTSDRWLAPPASTCPTLRFAVHFVTRIK